MELETEQLANNIKRIALNGRLDFAGVEDIDVKFTALAAAQKEAIAVDLSAMDFIASIGMRTLVSAAKAQSQRGGKIVFYSPKQLVREVLDQSGISQVLPILDDLDSAVQELQSVS